MPETPEIVTHVGQDGAGAMGVVLPFEIPSTDESE